jgi:hypothetical protein
MHKNFRNSHQVCSLIFDILEKNYPEKYDNYITIFKFSDSKIVTEMIEKRVKSVGNYLVLPETLIKKKLLIFIKKNRVAMRTEEACCRYIKQFDATAFLYCDTCNQVHESLSWELCKNCGSFNKFKI